MSIPDLDLSQLPPTYFDSRISGLEARVDRLVAELKQAEAQLDWWRRGRDLFISPASADDSGDEAHHAAQSEADPKPTLDDLVPSGSVLDAHGAKPTVRNAILRIMLDRQPVDGNEAPWPAKELIAEMERRDWLPGGKNAVNNVRRMLRQLADDGPLVKPAYGVFSLAPSTRDGEMAVGVP